MVVFVCGFCNESLRKNVVEAHFIRCRSCRSVSCVDCQKEFNKESFKAHSTCISESEKYDKGRNSKRPGSNKQERWTEMVREVINKCDVNDSQLRQVLRDLESCPNLPRKKPKFENFMKSKYRWLRPGRVEEVWTIISKCFENEQSNEPNEAKRNRTDAKGSSTQPVTPSTASTASSDIPSTLVADARRIVEESKGTILLSDMINQLFAHYSTSGQWSGTKKALKAAVKDSLESILEGIDHPEDCDQSADLSQADRTINGTAESQQDHDESEQPRSMTDLICQILLDADGYRLSLKKLSKRLIQRYRSSSLATAKPLTDEQLRARLDRKLRKSPCFQLAPDGQAVSLLTDA